VDRVVSSTLATAIWQRVMDNLAESRYPGMDMRHVLRRKRVAVGAKPIRRGSGHSPLGASLGLRESDIHALIEEVRAGLPFKALLSFSSESSIGVPEIAALIELPERTLARRKVAGRLTSGESERLLRLSKVFEQAVRLFEGNVQAAVAWLKAPKRALGEKSPWMYLQTEIGAREVENLIGQLEHGVFV
jgi:putative toxin-antitoxin system antitoxin component (TIGR02293 family)